MFARTGFVFVDKEASSGLCVDKELDAFLAFFFFLSSSSDAGNVLGFLSISSIISHWQGHPPLPVAQSQAAGKRSFYKTEIAPCCSPLWLAADGSHY